MTLEEYLRTHQPGKFKPGVPMCQQHGEGDTMHVYFEDVHCYEERISDFCDVYRAFDDKRIVGVKMWNVRKVLADVPPNQPSGDGQAWLAS